MTVSPAEAAEHPLHVLHTHWSSIITSQDGDALTTKFYDCCKEPYKHMDYKFTVQHTSALPAPMDDYFASYKTDSVLVSDPKTTKLRGY